MTVSQNSSENISHKYFSFPFNRQILPSTNKQNTPLFHKHIVIMLTMVTGFTSGTVGI